MGDDVAVSAVSVSTGADGSSSAGGDDADGGLPKFGTNTDAFTFNVENFIPNSDWSAIVSFSFYVHVSRLDAKSFNMRAVRLYVEEHTV